MGVTDPDKLGDGTVERCPYCSWSGRRDELKPHPRRPDPVCPQCLAVGYLSPTETVPLSRIASKGGEL